MYTRFFDLSHDMLCVVSTNGGFVAVNASWTRMLGWTEEELYAMPLYDLVHPDDVDRTQLQVARLANGMQTAGFRNRYRCRDGSYRWIDWRASLDAHDGHIHAAGRDTQDLMLLNQGLRERDEQLTRLMAEQLDVRDCELRRISSALHDSAVQNSVAALMYLELARREELPEPIDQHLQRAEDQIRGSLAATRKVVQGLDPCEILMHDLGAAIESVASEVADQFSLQVDVAVDLPEQPCDQVAAMAFRVAREGIVNAGKHAAGSHVTVTVGATEAGIHVEVVDDGHRAASQPTGLGLGLGLPVLRERVRRMGGTLAFAAGADSSRLSAVIPAQTTASAPPAALTGPDASLSA